MTRRARARARRAILIALLGFGCLSLIAAMLTAQATEARLIGSLVSKPARCSAQCPLRASTGESLRHGWPRLLLPAVFLVTSFGVFAAALRVATPRSPERDARPVSRRRRNPQRYATM